MPTLPLVVALLAGAAGTEPIVTSDLLRLREITSIDVARDSTRAVFTLRSIGEEPTDDDRRRSDDEAEPGASYAYRSNLFLLDLTVQHAEPRQLTFGARRDRAPQLSPDGARVAFIRAGEEDADGAGEPQVWVLDLGGGEAQQLTAREGGTGVPHWSPDGRRILFSASVGFDELDGAPTYPSERPERDWNDVDLDDVTPRADGTRAEIRAWLRQNASRDDPVVINRINFQGEQSLRGAPTVSHLFLVDVDQSASVTRVTDGFLDHREAMFTPDGRSIVYAAPRYTDQHPDRVLESDLRMIDVDGTDDHVVLTADGWTFGQPRPNIDGSIIAFTGRETDEPSDRQRRIGLVTVSSDGASEPVWMTEPQTFDASVGRIEWMTARNALLFTAPVRGGVPLLTIGAGLLKPASLVDQRDGQPVGVGAFDVGGGVVMYAETSPSGPSVLRVQDGAGDRPVWDPNPWIADKRLAMPREQWIERPDGTRVQSWLMEPADRDPNATYPLALQIHGGPSAMWGPGERSMWFEFQLLCSWGYAVVYSNPRGSGGYGYAFQRANFQDWGETPAGDVLAAVDHVVATNRWIDPDRLVVTGGSYAGYLTAWIVAHDHRFKAAVAQRGVYDLATFFGEGNAWRLVEWEMGGYPWDPRFRQVVRRNSPFTYAAQVRTPLLIMHASQDLRTGVSQSEMLYRALKALDRPVEYVRYPGTGHELSRSGDPAQRMDRLNRIIEFFERHIENARPAPVVGDEATAVTLGS